MNIKIGDKVIAPTYINGGYKILKVKAINNKTISLGLDGEYRGYANEPKQKPENWKVYDEIKVAEMRTLNQQIEELRERVTKIYDSLETVDIKDGK